MYCEKCGAKLLPGAAFCEGCGTAVNAAATPPAPVQMPAAYSQPATPQKKSGARLGIIILAVVLLAVAAVAMRFAGIIGGGEPGADSVDTPPAQEIQPAEKPDTPPAQEIQPADKPEPQNAPETPPASAEPEKEDAPGANEASMQLSATEIPNAGDFAWFTDKAEGWEYGTAPAGADTPEDVYALLGSWKGLQMIYDFDGTVLGYGYFTATFEESGSNIAATLDWHNMDWADGSHEELTDSAGERMTGSFAAPTLTLGEAGSRMELILYAMDGKQYAEGVWTVQSGEEVRVALVRP